MNKILRFSCAAFLVLCYTAVDAQSRTEFLDAQWKTVASSDKAKYSRAITLVLPDSAYAVTVNLVDGETIMQGSFKDKVLEIEHGDFTFWYDNGNMESKGRFKEGYKVGVWKRWNSEGIAKPDRIYPDENSPVTGNPGGPKNIIAAKPPGGMQALQRLVNDSLSYPEEAKNRGLEGTVYITFTIDATGEVRLPEISDGVHYLLDEEALRFVSSLPSWTPASKNGIPCESSYVMPITFDLGGSDSNGNSGRGSSSKN
ncbi:MAG: TonB family protein [Flavobacteriales bacterium]